MEILLRGCCVRVEADGRCRDRTLFILYKSPHQTMHRISLVLDNGRALPEGSIVYLNLVVVRAGLEGVH